MLNPPTFVEHSNDYAVNGTILKCSPPKSSNQHFNIKKYNRFSRRRHGYHVVGQMARRNHVFHVVDLYVTSCG
jgi:hypothetical protein